MKIPQPWNNLIISEQTKCLVFYLCFVALFGKSQSVLSTTITNALLDLYNATGGSSWKNNTNWKTGDPCTNSWFGVSCTGSSLTQLSMGNNKLSGTIPSSFGYITTLKKLYFLNNQLSGTIPPSIGNLTSFIVIILNNNQLSGTIPSSIGYLTSLTELNWAVNQLSGTIPSTIGYLTSLKYLSLNGGNQLSGTIPSSIGKLTSLTILYFNSNQLSGTIPPSIGNLTSLSQLNLGSNQLSSTIPSSIGNLRSLTQLYLYFNQLSGTIPLSIGNLTSLEALSLYSNQLSGTIPPSIWNLTSLTYLYLNANQLSGTIPPSIGYLTSLQDLNLENTDLQLCDCLYLPLSLNNTCNLTGITYPCNCSVPHICLVSACNNTFTCLPGIIPQPSSDVGIIPQPSSDVDIIPQPSSDVGIIPQPSSDVGIIPQHLDTSCQGNYETLFTCNNTKWIARNTILELNGTNLMNSFFYISSVFINENLFITDSYVNIKNNIFINKNSVLTLKNSNIIVEGDLYVNNESTIIFDETDNFTNININHCALLSGSLIVNTSYNSHIGKSLPILNYQCFNGTFSSIYFNLTDKPQCNVMPHSKYYPTSLIIFFDIPNQCSSEVPWVDIILGIVGFLFLIIFIVSVFVMSSKLKIRDQNINRLAQISVQK